MAKSGPPAKSGKKKRDRGAASLPCPKARCGGATEVLRTTRMSGGIVERHRRCLSCGKTFFSCEAVKEAA
jgi:RecJ-like exonuclease